MNFKSNIIAHTFRNKYLKYTGTNQVSTSNVAGNSATDAKIQKWFYEDENGNLHSKLNFVGDLNVSALGVADEGTGTTISIDVIDNLESTRPEAALSANQGRVLNEKIEEVKLSIETGGTGEASWLNLRDKPKLLTDANIQKWDDQSHTHTNKDVLDSIDETKINNWDDAHTHVSDGIRHITNDERSNWNKAVSDSHTHANKDVLDSITQTKVNNWDDVYTDFNDVFAIEGDILRVKLNLVGEKQVSAYGFSDDAGGVVTVDVIDNLTSERTDAALSANQGRVLKGLIDSKSSVTSWDDLTDKPSTFPPSTHTHNYASTVKVGSTSYNVSANTITLPAYPTIPSSLKNPYALTISLNGTSQGAYDGSAAKSINITASSVGAAASSHNHTKSQITDFPTTWSWSNITSKPSTLSGYGITDGVNSVSVTGSGNAVTSASIAGHTLTLTKGSTYLLLSQYTASDILSKLKTVDGSGSGLDADTIDGYNYSSFESYKLVVIDASNLNNNTWYPVTMSIGNSLQTRIRIEGNTSANASWNTRADKYMALILDYTVNGSSWGWTTESRVVYQYIEGAGTSSCLGGLGQLTNTSTEYVFVRGGATYNFYVSRFIEPTLRTSTYTISSQSVSPTTTRPATIVVNNALTTSNVASADKLTSSAGSSVNPVYFSNGKPVSCSYSFGNGSGNAAISNGTLCTNLNADKLDGTDKAGLLTALSTSSSTNVSITVGGTTKSISDLYATYTEKLLTSRTLWGQSFNGSANVSGNMTGVGSITASGNITTAANITADGTVVAKQASDARLKDVIKNKKTYQQRLLQLGKVIDFEYNKSAKERNTNAVDDNRHIGLIFQNVANSDLSNFVYKESDGYGSINYLSTDYINLIAGALQESIKEIKKLKREINKLKKQTQNEL